MKHPVILAYVLAPCMLFAVEAMANDDELLSTSATRDVKIATMEIKDISARQRYPWGVVDIYFNVVSEGTEHLTCAPLTVTATDMETGEQYIASDEALSGDTEWQNGVHHIAWNFDKQGLSIQASNMTFKVAYEYSPYCAYARYMIVDLSRGGVTYLDEEPEGGFNTDEYKTTKLATRLIEPGSFVMDGFFTTRGEVMGFRMMLTEPYYIGIFEVTQNQYYNMDDPGGMRPIVLTTSMWERVRGNCDWPTTDEIDGLSFMGRLRRKANRNGFDLPTEAQWEYACRAGTTSSFNNGGNTTNDLNEVGRYSGNCSDGKGGYSEYTVVGSYLPNAWGLYDMHGNVPELCLDWYAEYPAQAHWGTGGTIVDPIGPSSGERRIWRGGGWWYGWGKCTANSRAGRILPNGHLDHGIGFRVCCPAEEP